MSDDQVGAIVESGPSDWQILQQDDDGTAAIALSGRWVSPDSGVVQVRLVHEDTGMAVNGALDWQAADTHPDGHWRATLRRAPAGGLYHLVAGTWGLDPNQPNGPPASPDCSARLVR